MITIFDDDAQAVALMNMATAAARADQKLEQAFVDAGLLQAVAPGPERAPRTTNRRVEVAARKRVAKWMKAAVRQIEEQAARACWTYPRRRARSRSRAAMCRTLAWSCGR